MRIAPPGSHKVLMNRASQGIDKQRKPGYTVGMKIDTSTVGAKYLGYYAHMALAIPNPANRDHKQLSLMAQSCTLSYFGKANRSRVERILDELMKQPRYSG